MRNSRHPPTNQGCTSLASSSTEHQISPQHPGYPTSRGVPLPSPLHPLAHPSWYPPQPTEPNAPQHRHQQWRQATSTLRLSPSTRYPVCMGISLPLHRPSRVGYQCRRYMHHSRGAGFSSTCLQVLPLLRGRRHPLEMIKGLGPCLKFHVS